MTGSDAALQRRIREVEERLATLQEEVDAARGEMAPAALDPGTLRRITELRRELDELRARLESSGPAS